MTDSNKLTGKQEKFCQGIADGLSQADAYRSAYNAENMKPESVQVNASKLMADAKVAQRVADLKKRLENKALWTREMSVKALVEAYKVAREGKQSGAMTGAVKELNAMHGFNEPMRVDHLSSDGSLRPVEIVIEAVSAKGKNPAA